MEKDLSFRDIYTFERDKRLTLSELYSEIFRLRDFGWEMQEIFIQEGFDLKLRECKLPVWVFCSPEAKKGFANSVWILAGIHGEEPAGPCAIAKSVEVLAEMGNKYPLICFPLLNPLGYIKDWRYPNEPRDIALGLSVGDSEAFLLTNGSLEKPYPRKDARYVSEYALKLGEKVLELSQRNPPFLVLNFHEDEDDGKEVFSGSIFRREPKPPYIYSHGRFGTEDLVAKEIVSLMRDFGLSLENDGFTRFGEKIVDGIVGPVSDGSIDELISARMVVWGGKLMPGPAGVLFSQSVIVVETPTQEALSKRIRFYQLLIKKIPDFFDIALNQARNTVSVSKNFEV